MLRLFFFILSLLYIAAIFIFAGSSMVSDLSFFNPSSILHIPLYGILTTFLSLSMKRSSRLWIPGLVAFVIAIVDEIYQGFVPGRDASVIDGLIDVIGIVVALCIIRKVYINRSV
jgi:VanZ family protein